MLPGTSDCGSQIVLGMNVLCLGAFGFHGPCCSSFYPVRILLLRVLQKSAVRTLLPLGLVTSNLKERGIQWKRHLDQISRLVECETVNGLREIERR